MDAEFNVTFKELHFERMQRQQPRLEHFDDALPDVFCLPGSALGSHTWGAAVALSRYIVAHAELVADRSVIELGAGTGLCGLTCAMQGCRSVLLTDLPINVPLMQRSVSHNGAERTAQVRALDWRENTTDEFVARFDLVVMADVVYCCNHELFEHLVSTVLRCVGKEGQVWLCYKKRDANAELYFFQLMKERLFVVTERTELDAQHTLFKFEIQK